MERGRFASAPGDLMAAAATETAAAVAERLGTSLEGLSSDAAAARLRSEGPNVLPRRKGRNNARRFLDQITHLFAMMLWTAAGLAFVAGMPQLAWAIIAVVVINGVFSFAQEYRAERATRALAALLPQAATVIRDGRRTRVPAADLVPGDVVDLREGDRVPADGRVVRSDELRLDLSSLSGESAPVFRSAEPSPTLPPDLAEARNLVFAGTHVVGGSGQILVLATGAATRFAGIARLSAEVERRRSPLQQELDRVVRVIAGVAVAAGAVFFGTALTLGMPVHDGFLFAVGVIVALVPEGLLPTTTLSLAMSATRMAHAGALVRRLESVETLGSTTVICTDKTGTMTANQMTVREVVAGFHRLRLTGIGYDPAGAVVAGDRPLNAAEEAVVVPLMRAAALCNDARLERRDGQWACSGDPTEGALLVAAGKGGIQRVEAERTAPRVREFPFESARQRMTTIHALSNGAFEVVTKGSPEAVLAISVALRNGDDVRPLGAGELQRIRGEVDRLASAGYRVLAFARREVPAIPRTAAHAESGMEVVGLAGLEDPLRPEVPGAIRTCERAGIRVLMVTGDHPRTAEAVARKAGLPGRRVLLGPELPAEDDALATALQNPDVSVLARVVPEQKLQIARALELRGEVVAMTGDGVNDAPALRQADIGVAMGATGTDVARGAADLVLLDDDFAHIVEAVKEGRAAFANIRRFLTYHLTDNVAELAPFVIWALSGGRFPLLLSVLQILALDIGTDLLPALALGGERPERGVMQRPPRSRSERLIGRRVIGRAFGFLGPVEAAVSLAMAPVVAALFLGWIPRTPLPSSGPSLGLLSTTVFASIVVMQLANAFECRSTPESLFTIGPLTNRLLVAAAASGMLALLAFVYIPGLSHALGNVPLEPSHWIPIAVTPVLLLSAEETRKWIVRRAERKRQVERHRVRAGRRPSRFGSPPH